MIEDGFFDKTSYICFVCDLFRRVNFLGLVKWQLLYK